MPNLGKAYVQIVPSAEGISGSIENLLGEEASNAGISAGNLFSNGFEGGLGSIASIAADVVGGVVDAIGEVASTMANEISGIASYGDSIDKLSQKMGISAQAYQEWDFIAQHSGTSMESLRSSFKTLSNAAQDGKASFEAIGLSLEDVQSMSTEDLFGAVIEGLQGMEEGTERTAIASELLGKGATELGALLNTSAEDTAAMKQQVHDLGGVLSDEAVKDAAAFQDSLQNLNVSIDGLKNGLLSDLLPGITTVMDGLTKLVTGDKSGLDAINTGIKDFIGNLSSGMAEMLPVVTDIVLTIGESIIENAPLLIESAGVIIFQLISGIISQLPSILSTGLSIIVTLIKSITDNLPMVIKTATQIIVDMAKELTNPDTLVSLISSGIEMILALIDGVLEALPILLENMPIIIDNVVSALLTCMPLLIDAGFKLFSALLDNLPQIITLVVQATIQIADSIIKQLIEKGPDIIKAGYDLFVKLIDKIPEVLAEIKKSVISICNNIVTFFSDNWATIKNIGKNLVDKIWEGITGAWQQLKTDLSGLVSGLIDDAINGFKGGKKQFDDAVSSYAAPDSLNVNLVNSGAGFNVNAETAYDGISGNTFNLLAEYLPVIAAAVNEGAFIKPNEDAIFSLVRSKNTLYTDSTNYNPLVSG